MKIKNFVVLGLLLVWLLVGGGCSSIRTGDNLFETLTVPLGLNAHYTDINITIGLSDCVAEVWEGNVMICRERDKRTHKLIKPYETFVRRLGDAFVRQSVQLKVIIYDPTKSRVRYWSVRSFPVYPRGVNMINWNFFVRNGRITDQTDGSGGGWLFGFY